LTMHLCQYLSDVRKKYSPFIVGQMKRSLVWLIRLLLLLRRRRRYTEKLM